jgi:hypothetical protein
MLLGVIALTAVLAGVAQTEPGLIEGTVIRSGTKEPISAAAITLFRSASVLYGEPVRVTVTDRNGRFSIENLPAGSYAVTAQREGFFGRGTDPESPGFFDGAARWDTAIVIVSAAKSTIVTLELIPAAVITGLVTDSQGVPLVQQDVRAFRAHRRGDETLLRGVTTTQTDDRGQYRLHTLPPGEYFIASGLGFPEVGDGEPNPPRDLAAPETEKLVLTFHPSTTNPEIARPVFIRGGEDLPSIDIRVRRAPVLRISGYVVGDVREASVQLLKPKNWSIDHGGVLGGYSAVATATANFTDSPRGKFEFRGVFPPGIYELRAQSGSTRLEIGSQNIDGVIVEVRSPRVD